MESITIIIAYLISVIQNVLMLMMIARVVLSWLVLLSGVSFINVSSQPFFRFIIGVTEIIVYPVRVLFNKMGIEGYIIDFPFILTFILISAGGDLLIYLIAGAPIGLSIF